MILIFPPSVLMGRYLHVAAEQADKSGREYENCFGVRSDSIEPTSIAGLECLRVGQARKHTDPEFRWTALWVLRSQGHRLHTQDRPRKPTATASAWLHAGALVAFDTRLPHWTECGRGALIAAAFEFTEQPTGEEVHANIDRALHSIRHRMTLDRNTVIEQHDPQTLKVLAG